MAKMLELVPQEFHGREYLKPILEMEQGPDAYKEVFKKLDGAESLLGKRPPVPARDAKGEDLDKFFSQYRPDKAEEYEYKGAAGEKVDDGFMKTVREAFHAAKLHTSQAATIFSKLSEYSAGQRKAFADAQTKKQQEWDTLAKAMLGEKNKETIERAKVAWAEHAPQAARGQLDKLTDEQLLIVAAITDGVLKKYVPEDQLKGKGKGNVDGAGAAGGQGTVKEKRDRAMALMKEKAYTDAFDSKHEATVAEVNALYKEIGAMSAGAA